MKFDLRKARKRDLDDLMAIEEACFSDSIRWSHEDMTDAIDDGMLTVLVDPNLCVVAYMAIVDLKRSRHIDSIAVHPDHSGRGLGRRLMNYAHRGQSVVKLEVDETNVVARGLYESLGYQQYGSKIPNYYGQGRHALKMRRQLI